MGRQTRGRGRAQARSLFQRGELPEIVFQVIALAALLCLCVSPCLSADVPKEGLRASEAVYVASPYAFGGFPYYPYGGPVIYRR